MFTLANGCMWSEVLWGIRASGRFWLYRNMIFSAYWTNLAWWSSPQYWSHTVDIYSVIDHKFSLDFFFFYFIYFSSESIQGSRMRLFFFLEMRSWGYLCKTLYAQTLENPMDRGAWQATVHRVAQNRTWLKQLSTHAWSYLDQFHSF